MTILLSHAIHKNLVKIIFNDLNNILSIPAMKGGDR